jgi:hypothetical protein
MNARSETFYNKTDDFDLDTIVRLPAKQKAANIVSIAKPAKWLKQTNNLLYSIIGLDNNWDSYGAKRISSKVAEAVSDLLCDIMQRTTPAPQIVPSANGSMQLEWHLKGIDLEIEVKSFSKFHVFFEDAQNIELPWEGDIDVDLSKLVCYINLLTNRVQQSTN